MLTSWNCCGSPCVVSIVPWPSLQLAYVICSSAISTTPQDLSGLLCLHHFRLDGWLESGAAWYPKCSRFGATCLRILSEVEIGERARFVWICWPRVSFSISEKRARFENSRWLGSTCAQIYLGHFLSEMVARFPIMEWLEIECWIFFWNLFEILAEIGVMPWHNPCEPRANPCEHRKNPNKTRKNPNKTRANTTNSRKPGFCEPVRNPCVTHNSPCETRKNP